MYGHYVVQTFTPNVMSVVRLVKTRGCGLYLCMYLLIVSWLNFPGSVVGNERYPLCFFSQHTFSFSP